MTRSKHTAVIVFVLAWAALICAFIARDVWFAERKAAGRAIAVTAQQEATYSTHFDTLAPKPDEEDKPPYLGEFKITVYTPYCDNEAWGYQTATGTTSEHLMTCAVDPELIALGSVIYCGDIQLVAADTGSSVKGAVIDIFYDGSKAEALEWLAGFGDNAPVWLSLGGESNEIS